MFGNEVSPSEPAEWLTLKKTKNTKSLRNMEQSKPINC